MSYNYKTNKYSLCSDQWPIVELIRSFVSWLRSYFLSQLIAFSAPHLRFIVLRSHPWLIPTTFSTTTHSCCVSHSRPISLRSYSWFIPTTLLTTTYSCCVSQVWLISLGSYSWFIPITLLTTTHSCCMSQVRPIILGSYSWFIPITLLTTTHSCCVSYLRSINPGSDLWFIPTTFSSITHFYPLFTIKAVRLVFSKLWSKLRISMLFPSVAVVNVIWRWYMPRC